MKVENDAINKEISEMLSLQQDLPIIFRFRKKTLVIYKTSVHEIFKISSYILHF